MRIKKSTTVSMIALAFACLSAPVLLADDSHGTHFRWDIFHFIGLGTAVVTFAPGGTSTSQATFEPAQLAGDDSTITLTGDGTFNVRDPDEVTGGGTWTTAAADGTVTGSGTYKVTELVFAEFDGQSLAGVTGIDDDIGSLADVREGIAVMKVAYSDGTKGILTVVCNLGLPKSPPAIIEGTTATKGVVDYAVPLIPVPATPDLVTGNTLFHVIHEHEE
jgi:hypothetical protein